jgi:uncharacterized membrane protein
MHPQFASSILATLTALVPSPVSPVTPQDYTFQSLDAPGADTTVVSVFGSTWSNDSGLIFQQYYGPNPQYFWGDVAVLDHGAWSVIDVPGSIWCGGSNPNDSGRIALTYASSDGTVHLATWRRGKYTLLPDVAGLEMYARGIDNGGQVAGFAFDSAGNEHGFVRDAQQVRLFDYPLASPGTAAMAINDAGAIIGWYDSPDGTIQSFLLVGDQYSQILPPGSTFTYALSINNQGVISGGYLDDNFVAHGFLLSRGTYTIVDYPGAYFTKIDSVSDQGDIAGGYVDFDGTAHGYVATPIHGN